MSAPYPTVVQVPVNCSSITLSDGAHSPVNQLITDASDADATTLVESFNAPAVVTTNPANGQTTISLPGNITSITINGNTYTPDGSRLNTITGPDADMTLFIEQGFVLADSASSS